MSHAKRIKKRIQKPKGYRPILTIENAKTSKGEKLGYLTGICYLAPADLSGHNVCIFAGNCKKPCLNLSGRGKFAKNQRIRLEKTNLLFDNEALFLECLRYDIKRLIRRARRTRFGRRRMKPAVRINGTSDIPKLALWMSAEFPEVEFYDYTKCPKPWLRTRSNYHITFSHDGPENLQSCMDALQNGVNVAVVFAVKKGQPLPNTWYGYPVVDGDLHDLRFTDPQHVVVGLRAKGPAIGIDSPFVVIQ